MNKIFLIGNLTSDPEMRTTPNGVSVCTMNIAVNRRFSSSREERQTDFFRITAWRQLGESCGRFLSKGKKVCVVGELTARTYEAKDGTTRVSLEVTADEVEFLSPRENNGYPNQGGYQQPQGGYQQPHGGYQQQGYARNYPPQDPGAHNQGQNGWQAPPSHGGNEFAGTPLNPDNSSDGFTEINDDEYPF